MTFYNKILPIFLVSVLISSCSGNAKVARTVANQQTFRGIVVSDEPQATIVGQNILANGGSAGDAMAAMGLAMSVTMPSRVGLDGSGFCQLYNPKEKNVQTLDFITNNLSDSTVIPALPRALFAIYAKAGNLRWPEIVFPAESLAKFDMKISRAFVKDLETLYQAKSDTKDIYLARLISHFSSKDGELLKEGMPFSQIELATVLAGIRNAGAGDFYNGNFAKRYIEQISNFHSGITAESLANYTPIWLASNGFKLGNEMAYFPSDKLTSDFGSTIWNQLVGDNNDTSNNILNLLNNKNEDVASKTNYAASAIAVDESGMAIACTFSMGKLFGEQKILPTLGIVKASKATDLLSDINQLAKASSMIIINENVNEFRFIGSATGESAVSDLLKTSFYANYQKKNLETALQETADNDTSTINLVSCKEGLPPFPDTCEALNDIRADGYFRFSGVPKKGKRPAPRER
ncbi:MAG: gamma-glutamyltransferase [Alphaproteobacteria bacterium]